MEVTRANVERVRDVLVAECGSNAMSEISECLGGCEQFLLSEFPRWHNQLYRRRPRILAMRCGSTLHFVSHEHATAARLSSLLRVPTCWDRFVEDGILINFAPLHERFADATQRRYLKSVNDDLRGGKYEWSETAKALAKH